MFLGKKKRSPVAALLIAAAAPGFSVNMMASAASALLLARRRAASAAVNRHRKNLLLTPSCFSSSSRARHHHHLQPQSWTSGHSTFLRPVAACSAPPPLPTGRSSFARRHEQRRHLHRPIGYSPSSFRGYQSSVLLLSGLNFYHHRPYQIRQQRRHYLYLPTSWTELKLRVSAALNKRKRILHVVIRDRMARLRNSGAYRGAITRLSSGKKAKAAAMWFARQDKYRAQFRTLRYRAYRRQRRMKERAQIKFQGARVKSKRYLWELRSRGRGFLRRSIQRRAIVLEEYAEPDWFDGLGRPLTSRDATGRFVNPWQSQSTDGVHGPQNIIRWRVERFRREFEQYGWSALLPSHWRDRNVHVFMDEQGGRSAKKSSESGEATTADDVWLETCRRIQASAFLPPYNRCGDDVTPSVDLPPSFPAPTDPSVMSFTWIGHATCVVQSQGATVLVDPMLSNRAGPWQNFPVGMSRDLDPACTVEQLPDAIDLCCVSHDHYDHLDRNTVEDLADRVRLWVVPLGIAEWLEAKCGIPRESVIELEWWQSVKLVRDRGEVDGNDGASCTTWKAQGSWRIADAPVHPARRALPPGVQDIVSEKSEADTGTAGSQDDTKTMRGDYDGGVPANGNGSDGGSGRDSSVWITCCPAQHWASRTFFDRNYRLWCSFAIVFEQGEDQNTFFFGGDSALPAHFPLFEQISDYVGPIHLSALPIGAYQPDYYMRDAHMNPEEAVRVHQKLASQCSVGIHWGSFPLSEEPMDEPPRWLAEAAAREPLMSAPFGIVPHGGRLDVACRGAGSDKSDSAPGGRSKTILSEDASAWV